MKCGRGGKSRPMEATFAKKGSSPKSYQNLVLRPIHESSHIQSCVELEGEAEAGEYLMLFLELKTHLTPFWNSPKCQSDLSKYFSFAWLPLFWACAGGENNIATWFSFHFQVGAAVKLGVFIAGDEALPKITATNPAIVDYRNRACLYHLGHLWTRLSAVHAFYL